VNREGEVGEDSQVTACVVLDRGINPFHDFLQGIRVKEGWPHVTRAPAA
jgi:hypothetical protein